MLLQTVFFSIPEAIVIVWLATTLSGAKVKSNRIILMGIVAGLATWLFRPWAGSYFINVLLYTVVLVALLSLFKVAAPWERIASVIMAVTIYLIIEFINMQVILTVFNVSPELIFTNVLVRLTCFLPQLLAATLVATLLTKYRLTLFSKDNQV